MMSAIGSAWLRGSHHARYHFGICLIDTIYAAAHDDACPLLNFSGRHPNFQPDRLQHVADARDGIFPMPALPQDVFT